MTYRERRLAKADRLREWAKKREVKADQSMNAAKRLAGSIPFGQPVLVGHHSEGKARKDADRIHNGFVKAFENQEKAREFESRADSIETAADKSIYGDDSDAIPRLKERIAELEAEHGRLKAFNVSCRKGVPDETLLDEKQRDNIATIRRVCAYQLGKRGEMPGYALTNLSGNIARNKKRLAQIEHEAVNGKPWRVLIAKWDGICSVCSKEIKAGDRALYQKPEIKHETCEARQKSAEAQP